MKLWIDTAPPTEPVNLYAQSSLGDTKLVWRRRIDSGYYTLRLRITVSTWRRDFILRVDHREIAYHTGYYTREGKGDPPDYRFDFVLEYSGVHEIEIDCMTGTHTSHYPVHDRCLRIVKIGLEQRPLPEFRDIAAHIQPAREFQFGWGWQPGSDYQRLGGFVITGDYWRKRIIDESSKWGSNFLQIYPTASESYFKDASFWECIRCAHQMGMLVDEHAHDDRFNVPINKLYDEIHSHMEGYFDPLALNASGCLDGFETELYKGPDMVHVASRENFTRTNHLMWSWHPGVMIASCLSAPGENDYYLQWLHEDFHGPNYAHFLMCAGGWALSGYDDMDAMSLLPHDLGFRNEYNWVFRGHQANARLYSSNLWGGASSIDWIAKQNWDFFRLNARALREGRMPLNSFLAWLGEDIFTLPEDLRESVYAISMDPCRAALAYWLATTGYDGDQAWRKNHAKQGGGQAAYRPREWVASNTLRIHNGILAADHSAFGDQRKLYWDTEQLGHFDLNAGKLELAHSLFEVVPEEPEKPVATQVFGPSGETSRVWRVQVSRGTYDLLVSVAEADVPFRAELYLMGQFLGSMVGGANGSTDRFPCFVSDDKEHSLELRLADGCRLPRISMELLPTHYQVQALAAFGKADDSSEEFSEKAELDPIHKSLPKRCSVSASDTKAMLPRFISSNGVYPQALDIYFDGDAGSYLLTVRVRSEKPQQVDVTLNSHRFSTPEFTEQVRRDGKEGGTKPADWPAWLNPNDWLGCPGVYGRIHAFEAGPEWQTFQAPIVCAHNNGKIRHKVELSIPAGGGAVELDTIALYRNAVERRIDLAGGHQSVVEESMARVFGGSVLNEKRRIRLVADEPTLFLEMDRKMNGDPINLNYRVDGSSYTSLEFNGKSQNQKGVSTVAPDAITLRDHTGLRPPLTFLFLRRDGIEGIRWSGGMIELKCNAAGEQRLVVAATLRDPACGRLAAYLAAETEKIHLGRKGHTIVNKTGLTEVRLLNINNPEPGPYFVQEKGWWSVRGAQPLKSSESEWAQYIGNYENWRYEGNKGVMPLPPYDSDLVRLNVSPGEEARIQRYGYIDGVLRPGWGSQKQMVITDVQPEKCTVRVLSVTPYIYAPRIEFSKQFVKARLDGKPWAYHDGNNVFLPQEPGEYRVEVSSEGNKAPTLVATAALVKAASYEDSTLTVKITPPPYVFKLPGGLCYHLGIEYDSKTFALSGFEGGEIVRRGARGAVIKCLSDLVHMHFSTAKYSP